jgi:hypothetical protein
MDHMYLFRTGAPIGLIAGSMHKVAHDSGTF